MLYLIASEGREWTSPISKRFGHAAYHLVVESDPPKIVEAQPHEHDLPGHGLGRFAGIKLSGVISGNVGPGAFQDLVDHGLDIYIVRGKNVEEALKMVSDGELTPISEPTMKRSMHDHGGEHHHGEDGHHGGGHHH